ncbi:hypothetical protein [Bradyrhizobium sp. 23]|uniref:hypothetical protein n=1 Tax=Bradyrhizobium sp. 23 TaxID=2782667 RepID=UPI001FFAD34B|nr:hypothetical protein [Bradyrhizobium sp. 23]MCK1313724.1 hypothetical protein [Bradyrhizobium sp. 23]
MGNIKLKHYVLRKGKHGYWLPTAKMRVMGFQIVSCGHDGPHAWAIAKEWEERYQRARKGLEKPPAHFYPPDSVGDGFERFRRSNEWKSKPPRTREDWDRGWKYIDPVFGDVDPKTVTFEMLDRWYGWLKATKGNGEAGRALKIWRALYNVLAGMKLCTPEADPSQIIRKAGVPGRTETWQEGEVVRLIKEGWRAGYRGLACIIAIAWDTGFAPVDARTLTPAQAVTSGADMAFTSDRAKTGEPAIGTLTARSQRLVEAYVADLDYELHDDAPIFRTKGFKPTGKGGRPRLPVPYTKDSLIDDFADLRRAVFGKGEMRRLMDMRRTGAVEANAGGAPVEAIAAKMANSIDQNRKLQKTYMPVNIAAVRAADEARKIGRRLLGSEQNKLRKLKLGGGKS